MGPPKCDGYVPKVESPYKQFTWREEDDFVDEILAFSGSLWAHAGGRFDTLWLLDHIARRKLAAEVTSSGAQIIMMRVGELKVFDSHALTKISLKNLTAGNAIHKKTSTSLPCICGSECGGYCSISRSMSPGDMKALLSYLHEDCASLFEALEIFSSWAEDVDIDLGATIGSSAWHCVRRTLGLKSAALDVQDHVYARSAYFGGRVQLFRPRSERGWEYDVASMYPSQLATRPVPVGASRHCWGKAAEAEWTKHSPGMYTASVRVPRCHIPPLPMRHKGRLFYPYGRFVGTWTLPELSYAQSIGVEILGVTESITWDDEKILFAEWIAKLFGLRIVAPGGKSGPIGTFCKYYMNSLTGKFGSHPEKMQISVNPKKLRVCRCEDDCDGKCGAHQPLNVAGTVFGSFSWQIDACAHIEWAAYLTSTARVEWHRQATALERDGLDVVYGDTDSLFVERKRTRNIGTELGQWEEKGEYANFHGLAPKVYTFERGASVVAKAKGFSLGKRTGSQARELLVRGTPVSKDGIGGFRSSLRLDGEFFSRRELTRHVGEGYGDRVLDAERGITEPRDAADILAPKK
jgi:hypothetical protein